MKKLQEFEEWFDKIVTQKLQNEKMQFVWELMKSHYVEYHYELLKNKTIIGGDFWMSLCGRFDEHKEKGELLLLSKLDNNEDIDFQAEIIFLLGTISGQHKNRTLEYARQFTNSEDDYTRDRAIIVLGWLGTIQDTKLLEKHLLDDTNSKCRAWSASSYMQMWFRRKSDNLKINAFKSFQKALQNETDYFVLATIIEVIREIGQTKLGISQTALDNLEIEKIDITRIKAMRYLDKILKNA